MAKKYEDHSAKFLQDFEQKVLRVKVRLMLIATLERAVAFCFVKSGNLKRSLGYEQIDNTSGIVSDGVKYGYKIETEYHPFLRPAVRNSRAIYKRIMAQ